MPANRLEGFLVLAKNQANHSRQALEKDRQLYGEVMREENLVRQYIAEYEKKLSSSDYAPVVLAHTRTFVNRLSEQLVQLEKSVIDCRSQITVAEARHFSHRRRVMALECLIEDRQNKESLALNRREQMEQDEVAGRQRLGMELQHDYKGYEYV